jgi:hypothetical protein
MRCDRCHSQAVYETRTCDEEGVLWLWRCPICGDVRDSVIDFHHNLPVPPEPHVNILPVFHARPDAHLELIRQRRAARAGKDPHAAP